MKRTRVLIPILLLVVMLAFQACSDTAESDSAVSGAEESMLALTLDELAQYDGKDGNPAYIAVSGVIYDVTDVPEWAGGEHNGFSAGQDLTDEIRTISPHGVSKLTNVPVVGTLEG